MPQAGWHLAIGSWGLKWALWGAAPLAVLAIVAGLWSLMRSPAASPDAPAAVEEEEEPSTTAASPGEEPLPPRATPMRWERRWLPERARLVFHLRASRLAAAPQSGKFLGRAEPVWRQSVGAVVRTLGLSLDSIESLTWSLTDLAQWRERSVILIRLAPDNEAHALAVSGEAADIGVTGLPCRRLPGAAWPYPFVVIDDRTIVTGHEELLRGLLARDGEAPIESAPIERLLKVTIPEADATLLVDLAAARQAKCSLPAGLMDVWPAGERPWHAIWEIPEGLGFAVRWSEPLQSTLALVCEGETSADKVRAALDELIPAVKNLLPAQRESLRSRIEEGKVAAAAAGQYQFLLEHGLAALQSARTETADSIVWVRLHWGQSPMDAAVAALESLPVVQGDWLSAARAVDEARHRRLLAGLQGHVKAEAAFPSGAMGGTLLPPETRLSWIAAMLPYYDHADWHRQLEFGYPWNSTQNRKVAQRPLGAVVNPVLGPCTTEAGFPVTHYVGVAGVGAKAGHLPATDRRAGVFGYGRMTRLEDIGDGAANTIALLGVTGRCGPWAAGGDATVRALTERPYVNGPDGFGSGQPDGMLAGMADGSVRFLLKDTDPRVIEQMATINGREELDLASLDRQPRPKTAPPKAEPVAEAKPQAAQNPATQGPADAEVRARLKQSVLGMKLPKISLSQAADLLTALSTVPIGLDADALQELGVTLRDPVAIDLDDATVAQALDAMVAERKLVYVVDNGQVLITAPASHRELFQSVRYRVSDLTGDDAKKMADLATLVQKLVAPDTWQSAGGRGTIQVDGDSLVITQTGNVHYQVLTLCEKLRTARGKPLRSHRNPDLFALATRTARAKGLLEHPLTVNFSQGAPLPEIVSYLKKEAGADIVVDRAALRAEQLAPDLKGTVRVEGQSLAAALAQWLEPLKLGCRVVDATTVQITTRKALNAHVELEFYPVGSLLAKGQTASGLIDRIKSRLAGDSWSEAGGPGTIYYDDLSQCLVVLQSQPVQAAIEALLAEPPK